MGIIEHSLQPDEVVLTFELPKVSLNMFYAGIHWSDRKRIKDNYTWLVRAATKQTFNCPCKVTYDFEFKANALDVSNCVGMIKMLEDCLFKDDGVKIVKEITIRSRKSTRNLTTVTITKLQP
jgi:hypothetical protein